MINREKARSEQDLKLIEEQAYEAWKNRDYVLVAALYQSIE
jgi:predicted lipid-binding transport protein (Tim44 family)